VARPFGRSFLGSFLGRLAKGVPTVYTCEHRHEENQLSEGSTEAQTFDTLTGFRGSTVGSRPTSVSCAKRTLEPAADLIDARSWLTEFTGDEEKDENSKPQDG
jgi:hypothetical protein